MDGSRLDENCPTSGVTCRTSSFAAHYSFAVAMLRTLGGLQAGNVFDATSSTLIGRAIRVSFPRCLVLVCFST